MFVFCFICAKSTDRSFFSFFASMKRNCRQDGEKIADVQPPASVVQISPKRRDQIERNVTEEGEKDKDFKNDNNNNKREKIYIYR